MKYTLNTTAPSLTRAVQACAAIVPPTPPSSRPQDERTCQVRLEATEGGLLVLSGTDRVMFVRAYVEDSREDELEALGALAPSLPLPVWLGIVSEIGVQTYATQQPEAKVSLEFMGHSDNSLSVRVFMEGWSRQFDAARVEPLPGGRLFKTAHALAEEHPRRHLHTFSRSVLLRLGRIIDLTGPTEVVQLVAVGTTEADPVLVHVVDTHGTWCEIAVKPMTGADTFGGL